MLRGLGALVSSLKGSWYRVTWQITLLANNAHHPVQREETTPHIPFIQASHTIWSQSNTIDWNWSLIHIIPLCPRACRIKSLTSILSCRFPTMLQYLLLYMLSFSVQWTWIWLKKDLDSNTDCMCYSWQVIFSEFNFLSFKIWNMRCQAPGITYFNHHNNPMREMLHWSHFAYKETEV